VKVIVGIGALFSLGCLVWVIRSFSWADFGQQIANTDWRWIGVAVILDACAYVAQGARWSLLLGTGTLRQTTQAIYAGLFVSEVLPLRPGETLRAWLMVLYTKRRTSEIVTSLIWERWLDGLVLLVLLWVSSMVVPLPRWIGSALHILLLVLVIFAAVLMVLQSRRDRHGRSKYLLPVGPCVWGYSVLVAAAQIVAFWAVLHAAGAPLSAGAAVVVFLIVKLGTLIPGAPGNLGTYQASCIAGLSLFGITGSNAASLSMLVFFISTVPLYLVGWLALTSSGLTVSGAVRAQFRQTDVSTVAPD
jgi:uncharacterized membrane protein YbhN (UPF0104 family)